MDVVKRNVEALNGRLTIESTPGRGTRFQIRLPLTLAILDGLLLRTGSQTHVLPLLAVLEALRPRVTDLACLPDRGLVVSVRGEPVPLVQLGAILGVADAELDASRGLVVLVEHEGRRLGLLVDEVLGQAQVVVKDLESHFRHVEGVAGGTILGDGSAALILDVPGLTRLHERRARARADHSEARLLAAIAPGTTP
jgi:two-component system chemotaxis sensor kinase CheA